MKKTMFSGVIQKLPQNDQKQMTPQSDVKRHMSGYVKGHMSGHIKGHMSGHVRGGHMSGHLRST